MRFLDAARERRPADRRRVLEREHRARSSTPPASPTASRPSSTGATSPTAASRASRRRTRSCTAAKDLGVEPEEAAVFEDALAGVEAGRAGHFGQVVGVDRVGQADALREHGADVVVEDLAELLESA